MIVAKGLPPLPTAAPAPEPDPDREAEKSRPQDATVLLPIITHMTRTANDGTARSKFDALADMARHPGLPLPNLRADGKSDRGTRNSVIYHAVVRCMRLIRDEAPARAIKDAFNLAHDATFHPTCFVIGSQETGYTVTFTDPSQAGR
jgi:hypothetical protein